MKAPLLSQYIGLPSKGWGPFRYEWYSICSGHGVNVDGNYYSFDTSCDRCVAGHWVNCWMHEVDSFIHDHAYPLWYWWTNRSQFSFREGIKRGRKLQSELF